MRQQRTVDKLTSRGQPGMLMIVGWSGWITTSKTRTTHKKEKNKQMGSEPYHRVAAHQQLWVGVAAGRGGSLEPIPI